MKSGKFLIPVILVMLAALSCGKSGPGGKPVFKLVSIDKNPIKGNDSIVFHFTFENTSGKVASGTFTSIRVRQNQSPVNPSDSSGSDTIRNFIPDFEGASKGEFRYALPGSYVNQSTSLNQNDTNIIKFFILSNTGVPSDTIPSPKIIFLNH